MQYEYINSRHIKNSHISRAIYRGYGTLLPRRMHPVYLIKLGLTPDEIDVNVHPAKIEVRLKKPSTGTNYYQRANPIAITKSN